MIQVLVVDDSFFMRRVISDMLAAHPQITVTGEAANGRDALEKIAKLHPDVVTLDIEMPVMNGVETLEAIMKLSNHPAVVMVTGYAEKGADVALECLSRGATDFIQKPSGSFSLDIEKIKDSLIKKVTTAAAAKRATRTTVLNPPAGSPSGGSHDWHYHADGGIVVFGASTGGPVALERILPNLPATFPYPVVVAQHLPPAFTGSFAGRLQKKCQLEVVQAADGLKVLAGKLYIVAGGTTTTLRLAGGTPIFHVEENKKDIETPPINPLLLSAADIYRDKTVGIIMTGMGNDGAIGMARIHEVHGATVVQDEATSAVFGMGHAVTEKGVADVTVPLDELVNTVNKLLGSHG